MHIENFNLIELADHKLKKKQLEESLMYVYNMGLCYSSHVRGFWSDGREEYMGTRFHMPSEYNLGTTPLNEALIACLKMIPLFKNKYNIEKMTFITLTDGGANYTGDRKVVVGEDNKLVAVHKEDFLTEKKIGDRYISVKNVIKIGKKQYVNDEHRSGLTNLLLSIIQKEYNIKTIGFYVLKTIKWWDIGRFTSHIKDYSKYFGHYINISKETCSLHLFCRTATWGCGYR